MKLIRSCFFALLFLNLAAFGQIESIIPDSGREVAKNASKITRSSQSDTAFFRIELTNAFYDFSRQRLPYYIIAKTTAASQDAVPTLVINSVKQVAEPHATVIRKHFSKYLGPDFELKGSASICKGENLNRYSLVPFRINSFNQVEELTGYSVDWQVNNSANGYAAKQASPFKSSSVLATGNWYKIGVTQTGVYRLNKSFFTAMGANVSGIDPRKIRIYGNGGKMVPERNKDFRYDDLEENAIIVSGEADGSFDNADYVLFYATGTAEWTKTGSATGLKFKATTSLYSDTSFYFINFDQGAGKRMAKPPGLSVPNNANTNSYDYYAYHEQNISNFAKSGREFFGEYFDITTSYSFQWGDGDFVTGDDLVSEVSVAGKYSDSTRFLVNCGSSSYPIATRGLNLNDTYEDYASAGAKTVKGVVTNPASINLTISKTTAKAIGWLNKATVNTRRSLTVNGKQYNFRDTRVSGPGKISRFTLSYSGSSDLLLLNTSNAINPYIQEYVQSGSLLEFTAYADSLNEYCVVPQNDFYTPVFVQKVGNQNLHALQQADLVIIAHPLFLREAERLGAFHQQMDGLSYAVANTELIYNEFGSGKQDPAAIRDFIRMLYSRNLSAGRQVKYVTLMGDGSYQNKSRSLLNNSNLIPTYQSPESLSETMSVATDDFYGLMDDNEGINAENSGAIDIGIGRFTCRTNSEVKAILDKIVNYYKKDLNFQANSESDLVSESVMGDWRNWLIFLGDDEDNALHMQQSDQLSGIAASLSPACNIDKIFLDAYKRYSTAGGLRYPDATTEFLKRIKKGALVFNYTGHGGEVGLTAERMIDLEIINTFDNFNKLPLFITATCEFSRYDDPSRTSAGELCLLNPKGGAIALFTTCRIAFSSSNMGLNIVLLQKLFGRQFNGQRPRLGDVLQQTKAITGQALIANFHLLGDPALTLAYPQQKVVTTSINNKAVTPNGTDTLGALSKITISGYVADSTGSKMSSFNGLVYPTVFDKEQDINCLVNSDFSALNFPTPNDSTPLRPFSFKLQSNILYRGKIQVTNGDFTFSFLVPKDISFAPGPGKISYYATNGLTDAGGNYNRLVVGGSSKNGITDNEGPQIKLYLNDKSFVSGGITNEKPLMYANITDSSGINTVGTGIGHDISVVLDQNTSNPVILNDYYEANLNSYQSGKVRYPFEELSEGTHQLSFKAWDIQNNSSTVVADFIVAKSENVALQNVLNYPNPFSTHTRFLFQHNQGCNPIRVTVQIFTISGKAVKTLQRSISCDSYNADGIEWDGKDDYGDKLGKGVYIYKLAIIDTENKKAEKIEKLVILN